MLVFCGKTLLTGVPRAAVDVRRDGAVSCQLEARRARVNPTGIQSVGRPGRLERRLLPDTQRSHRRGRVCRISRLSIFARTLAA